jgi:hypothetical protein
LRTWFFLSMAGRLIAFRVPGPFGLNSLQVLAIGGVTEFGREVTVGGGSATEIKSGWYFEQDDGGRVVLAGQGTIAEETFAEAMREAVASRELPRAIVAPPIAYVLHYVRGELEASDRLSPSDDFQDVHERLAGRLSSRLGLSDAEYEQALREVPFGGFIWDLPDGRIPVLRSYGAERTLPEEFVADAEELVRDWAASLNPPLTLETFYPPGKHYRLDESGPGPWPDVLDPPGERPAYQVRYLRGARGDRAAHR